MDTDHVVPSPHPPPPGASGGTGSAGGHAGTGPLVTVIVTTYNRAGTVIRAVQSVLAQTHRNIDCVVVDDGSADTTMEILGHITDPRLRIFRHDRNRGSGAAKNTGLDNVRGEWFTFVDSDDEIVPEALEILLRVPETVDKEITKVECNAMNAASGLLTGRGIDHDQYLDVKTAMTCLQGDFWGIIRTDLLRSDRFPENLTGHESLLWNKIRHRAREYYLHRGLLITHHEGADRITTAHWDMEKTAKDFRALLDQREWLEDFAAFRAGDYPGFCFRGMLFSLAAGDRSSAAGYRRLLAQARPGAKYALAASAAWLAGPRPVRAGLALFRKTKRGSSG